LVAAGLLAFTILFYVVVYTVWLKRRTPYNIVIGGAAGALPPVIGWSAVTNGLTWAPVVLFGVIFLWTPPHFWALAIKYREDYAAADVPMLPAVSSMQTTNRHIVAYTIVLWASTLVFAPVADMGLVFTAAAIILGALFLWIALDLARSPSTGKAMRLFGFSITYLVLLFAAMAADQLIRSGF